MSQTILMWGRSGFARRVAHYIQAYGEYRDISPRYVLFEEAPLDMGEINDALFKSYTNKSGSGTPDIVVNMWEVEDMLGGENHAEHSFTHNTVTASNLALACRSADVRFLHVSTSHVFSGDRGHRSVEDEPNPISVYGLSKLKAEEAVLSIHEKSSVVRINPCYSPGSWPIGFRETPDGIEAATDIGGVPQFEGEAAFLVARNVLESPVLLDERVIHCASPTSVEPQSYYEFFSRRFPEDGFQPFKYLPGPGHYSMHMPVGTLVALTPTRGWNLSNDPNKHWQEYKIEAEGDRYIHYF